MSKQTSNSKFERDEETLARLLRLAGPRRDIPVDVEARVYEHVQREWSAASTPPDARRVYGHVHRAWQWRSPVRRWALPVALAASTLLAIAVVVEPRAPTALAVVPVGSIVKVVSGQGLGALPTLGDPVYPGAHLETGNAAGISLLLARHESLRLGENTALTIDSHDRITLTRGRVYADSGEFVYRDGGIVVQTAIGAVSDIGTQFAVMIDGATLDVAVREGRVDVQRNTGNGDKLVAIAGERLVVGQGGAVSTVALDASSDYWDWAAALAPAFEIENKSLLDFLRWAARETGKTLEFEDNELRLAAMRTDLHGSVSDQTPLDALHAVLPTTSFRYRIESEKIIIHR